MLLLLKLKTTLITLPFSKLEMSIVCCFTGSVTNINSELLRSEPSISIETAGMKKIERAKAINTKLGMNLFYFIFINFEKGKLKDTKTAIVITKIVSRNKFVFD